MEYLRCVVRLRGFVVFICGRRQKVKEKEHTRRRDDVTYFPYIIRKRKMRRMTIMLLNIIPSHNSSYNSINNKTTAISLTCCYPTLCCYSTTAVSLPFYLSPLPIDCHIKISLPLHK